MDKEFIDNPVEAYEKLKQENEQLKESTKFLRKEADILLQNLKERKADKYRQALEEIREIAKHNYYSCTDCDKQRKELNCNEKCNAYRLREIKDKINEVLK